MSDPKIRKGCDGKMKHPNETAVQYWIESNDKAGIEDYYHCDFCDNYHTFTVPGKKKLSHKKHQRTMDKLNKRGPLKMKLFGRDKKRRGKRK